LVGGRAGDIFDAIRKDWTLVRTPETREPLAVGTRLFDPTDRPPGEREISGKLTRCHVRLRDLEQWYRAQRADFDFNGLTEAEIGRIKSEK
jgi:hypothetical protein